MAKPVRRAAVCVLAVLAVGRSLPDTAPAKIQTDRAVGAAEAAYLDYLDAVGAVGYIESGGAKIFSGRDLAAWHTQRESRLEILD